jgi:hypothetical protein
VYDQEIIFVSDNRLNAVNDANDASKIPGRRFLKSLRIFERIGLCGA